MLSSEELEEAVATYQKAIQKHGGIRAAARELKIPESTIRSRIKKLDEPMFVSYDPLNPVVYRPHESETRYFILSSAQDGTQIHEEFVQSLESYARYLGNCEILISGFTYAKKLFENHDKRADDIFFDKRIEQYITHDRVLIGNDEDGLEFCGEMNTLPTAVRPLSGLQAYTGHRWGVFPHTKVQLESVPTMKRLRSKQAMTTGTVTRTNYIRKKAGLKAEFHHVYGAVLVELRPDGAIFARHLLATSRSDGSFYDLDRRITPRTVEFGHCVEGLTYGDIHHEKLDPVVALATWGYNRKTQTLEYRHPCLATKLKPRHEFFHDLSDFAPRNHHNIQDHHFRFAAHFGGGEQNNVQSALEGCSQFLAQVKRDAKQVVVVSNHDQALNRWLKTADYREDPENALFFLKCQTWFYGQLHKGVANPPIFERVLRDHGAPKDVQFVDEDSSYVICGQIECGMHGHLGANGARATPGQFVKICSKSNTGHTHSPTIIDGAYVAGVSATLDMGYNKGPSSWAQAHIVTYKNGKRAILTMCNGRFYAEDTDHARYAAFLEAEAAK